MWTVRKANSNISLKRLHYKACNAWKNQPDVIQLPVPACANSARGFLGWQSSVKHSVQKKVLLSKHRCTIKKPSHSNTLINHPPFQMWVVKGLFSWCVISSFYFPWNVNLGNYSSWLVTWRFCVTREEPEWPELLTDIPKWAC